MLCECGAGTKACNAAAFMLRMAGIAQVVSSHLDSHWFAATAINLCYMHSEFGGTLAFDPGLPTAGLCNRTKAFSCDGYRARS